MNAKAVFLMLLVAAPICSAYSPNYCPFDSGRLPATMATLCEPAYEQRSPDKKASLFAVGPGTLLVVQDDDPNGGVTASLLEKGKVVGGPVVLEGNPRLGLSVWAANLSSKDGAHKDVIIGTPTGGNGLSAAINHVCLFLRSKTGYAVVDGLTYNLDANDFVDLNKDGKAHNYWVLNLIEFREGRPTLANAIDKRFPSWIWFTNKPNHQNTVQLTAAQKQQLFREQAKGLEIYSSPKSVAAAK